MGSDVDLLEAWRVGDAAQGRLLVASAGGTLGRDQQHPLVRTPR